MQFAMDYQTRNIVILGIGFLFIYSGLFSYSDLQKTLLVSAHDDNPDFDVDGYTSFGILFSSAAISMWLAPCVIAIVGPPLTMLFGGLLYVILPTAVLLEETWLMYVAALLAGIGSSFLWTGSANYLVLNSTEKTVTRNSGLFWLFFQIGSLPGNLFVFFVFHGATIKIDKATRQIILFGVIGLGIIGSLIFLLLKREIHDKGRPVPDSPLLAFKKSWNIAKSKNIAILFTAFAYCGLHLAFTDGIYGACVGFTLQLGEGVKQLIPLTSILIGFGEIFGGALVKLFGNVKVFRINLFFVLAAAGNIINYLIVCLSLPANANFGNTYDRSIIEPRMWLLLTAAFFFGMGDALLHTQLYGLVGLLYPEDSAPAFCIFKFVRNATMSVSFYYGPYVSLPVQLIIFSIFGLLGTVLFNVMNFIHERKQSIAKT